LPPNVTVFVRLPGAIGMVSIWIVALLLAFSVPNAHTTMPAE
jgi:hypothetical protein